MLLTTALLSHVSAQTRIAVISDIHVMDTSNPELVTPGSTVWETALANDRKLLDYSKAIFDQLMEKFKAEKPDILLVTGDLTKDGEAGNLDYVYNSLLQLKNQGIKVYVIPGNHDIGNSNARKYIDGEAKIADTWSAVKFRNYFYHNLCEDEREYPSDDEEALTYAVEPVDGLVLIGIDSHTGSISAADLDFACNRALTARKAGKQVLAMMHHPLFPHINGADLYVASATVNDYENVRNRLADAGVRVVFSGHFHTSDIARDWNADLSKEIYDINTGSTVSYPCDYRELTLDEGMTLLTVSTGNVTTLEGVENFSEVAKSRLKDSMTRIAKTKITEKVVDKLGSFAAAIAAAQIEEMASLAADAFVIHAEGDENVSPAAADMLSQLSSNAIVNYALTIYPDYNNALQSVLTDTSNYGDADRADQTADRSLTIDLPVMSESLTLAADGWSTYYTDFSIDLEKTANVTGYIATSISETAVGLEEAVVIPANRGFILCGEGGSNIKLYATSKEADETLMAKNLLSGTLESETAPAGTYVLSNKSGVTGFYPASAELSLPAHKAYLVIPSGSTARRLVIVGDDGAATGISTLSLPEANDVVYTLQGIRTNHPSKGVFIMGGKLVIIK